MGVRRHRGARALPKRRRGRRRAAHARLTARRTRFAIALLDASLLGAAAVTLASSYAWGDYFGFKHSLHRGWRDASTFHGTYIAFVALAAMIVLIPGAPLGLITIGVQALAGVLLPSATVFLLLRFRRIDTDY